MDRREGTVLLVNFSRLALQPAALSWEELSTQCASSRFFWFLVWFCWSLGVLSDFSRFLVSFWLFLWFSVFFSGFTFQPKYQVTDAGPKWPFSKNVTSLTWGPKWPFSKNVTSLTRGPKWPFTCLDNWNFVNVSENLKNYRQNCWCKKIIDKLLISAKSYSSPTTSTLWIPLAYLSNDFPGDHCSATWFSWPLVSGSMSYRWVAAWKVDISVNTAKLGEHITPKAYSNRSYLCTSKRCQNSCNISYCCDVQIKASSLDSHCLANFTAQSWVQEDICNRLILSNCLIILFLPKFTSVF